MIIFSAKTFHENPREVYKAAMKGAVKVTHSHLGESFILKVDDASNGKAISDKDFYSDELVILGKDK